MRLIDHFFWVALMTPLLESTFVGASPLFHGLAVRDDNTTTAIPAQTSTTFSSSPSSSLSSASTSHSHTASENQVSTVLSGTSSLASLVPVPSFTSHTTSASTSTQAPVSNNPAAFFANQNSRIILISVVGGIVGIVVILTLWINFRRSWYFPWNKKKQKNNPARWSTYSFREKPRLPLGRTLVYTPSTENFAQRDATNADSSPHGHETADGYEPEPSEGHGYGSSEGHTQLLGMPPIPQIVIDSPKSAVTPAPGSRSSPWQFSRPLPPGLNHRSRWSEATSHVSAATTSVYSVHSDASVENARVVDKYAAREMQRGSRPWTGTTASSDNSPFRFDTPKTSSEDQNASTSRNVITSNNATSSTNPSIPSAFAPRVMTRERTVTYVDSIVEAPQRAHFPSSTRGSSILRELDDDESNAAGPAFGLSALKVNWDQLPMKQVGPNPMTTIDLAPSTPASLPKGSSPATGTKPGPKSILKTPHYVTTSERLARNGRPNRI